MTGDAEFDEVFFNDVRVPSDALLGSLGQGWQVAMTTLTAERGSVAAGAIALERRLKAATTSVSLSADPLRRQRLATLHTTGHALLLMIQGHGPTASTAASLSKLGFSELGFATANLSADFAGAEALLESDVARGLLASLAGGIAGGTSQVQRNIIGERLLGLPKEPGG
jgi:alkylation response protein AidB-like acyl-CoA dehydrogenase